METLNHEDATPEDMPRLLALLVHEVQQLRREIAQANRQNSKVREAVARAGLR